MTELSPPVIAPARGAWFVWIVPFLALLVGGYLLVREFAERGPLISITFSDGSGLEAGRTKILSRGVVVGQVEAVELAPDLNSVVVHARLIQSAKGLARSESRIWIVRPQISAAGIRGLDTLMSGAYLEIEPGEGSPSKSFEGLSQAPVNRGTTQRIFILHTPQKGSMAPGIPVLFRGMEVGRVEEVELAPDATEIRVRLGIDWPYHTLVREGTVFWDAGGVEMKVGLLGAHIRTGSLESMLSGAVALAVPPEAAEADEAAAGSHFMLHPEPKSSWLEWQTPISLPLMESGD